VTAAVSILGNNGNPMSKPLDHSVYSTLPPPLSHNVCLSTSTGLFSTLCQRYCCLHRNVETGWQVPLETRRTHCSLSFDIRRFILQLEYVYTESFLNWSSHIYLIVIENTVIREYFGIYFGGFTYSYSGTYSTFYNIVSS
jgi:hypothetical protein